MDKNLTEIIVITDRSGSMASVAEDAIGGFNTFLKEQQASKEGRCLMTYCQFDTAYEIVHEARPIADMKPLDSTTFHPRGGTALLDAVGKTISDVGRRLKKTAEDKRPGNVVVVILTDGEENSSQGYTLAKVQEMIKRQSKDYDWTFIFLGQGIDAFAAGHGMGLDMDDPNVFVGNMAAGGQGQQAAYFMASAAVVGTRNRVSRGVSKGYTSDEKEVFTSALSGEASEADLDAVKGSDSTSDSSGA